MNDQSPISISGARRRRAASSAEQRRREQRALRAEEDRKKRAWIEAGNELRQPPEYRGYVWDTPDRDGVHPTAFPPYRDGPQEGLSDEFIAFQAHNSPTYETHPHYYCPRCTIRYNARDGALCGPCIGETQPQPTRRGRRSATPPPTEYPL